MALPVSNGRILLPLRFMARIDCFVSVSGGPAGPIRLDGTFEFMRGGQTFRFAVRGRQVPEPAAAGPVALGLLGALLRARTVRRRA